MRIISETPFSSGMKPVSQLGQQARVGNGVLLSKTAKEGLHQ
jgi:hypothetical protein